MVQPCTGNRILFDASKSTEPDGEIAEHEWDFEGVAQWTPRDKKVEWTFTEEGTYTVVLIVTDDHGVTARKELGDPGRSGWWRASVR